MTDKQIIDCKYKFQNDEKFEGKPYCTLHNELCEDLSFACDDNCQVYEDYKQLKRKEQECEKLKQQRQLDKGLITATGKMNYQLIQEHDKLTTVIKQILQKISECEVEK